MKVIIATFLIVFVIGGAHSVVPQKKSTTNSTTISTTKTTKPTATPTTVASDEVVPGITVSKGFKKGNCLASRFAVLCASSTIDGCVTKDSKTKCGKQCVCSPSDCSCGKSGCYCQVTAGCKCNQ